MKAFSLKSVLGLCMALGLFMTSCKKDKEPTADLATQIAGTYSFTEIEFQGETIPAAETSVKGNIRISRATESTVDVDLNIRQKATNAEFMVEVVKGVVVSPGNGTIDLFYEGKKVATVKGNRLSVNSADESDEPFTLIAVK